MGTLTPVVQMNLAGCDLVALEANYDRFSLQGGPYPYYLKVRIASDRGHLDNRACAAELLELIQVGCKKFALCHLSQDQQHAGTDSEIAPAGRRHPAGPGCADPGPTLR